MKRKSSSSAFTLIELLVVIAIIAILAVVVVLTLNPAQLLAQSRDANRVSDMATLNSAINLYTVDQAGANFSLGTSSFTYLSIPDMTATTTAGTNCSGLGGNIATGTTFFDCSASSTFRLVNSQGWIPLNFNLMSAGSPFGSLPVDPTNNTSSNLYYSYQTNGSQFRIAAVPESQKYQATLATNPTAFMQGSNTSLNGGAWVMVPGNGTFGTGNFYVMKYDASCMNKSTGQPLTSPLDVTAVNGYNNGGNGVNANNCSLANSFAPTSIATGYPIVDVSQIQAASYCSSIGAHLMTNNEWQTIAWNLENNPSNWNGGVVGTSWMYSGHNDNSPANALVASADDTDGYNGTGNTTGSTQKRALTLSNGSVIWDMAGNLWQWTNDTIIGNNEPHSAVLDWSWAEFPSITSWGTLSQSTVGPMNAAWSHTQGIGEIYSVNTTTIATPYGFIRGGSWNSGGGAGVEALYLNFTPGSTYFSLGFRCAR